MLLPRCLLLFCSAFVCCGSLLTAGVSTLAAFQKVPVVSSGTNGFVYLEEFQDSYGVIQNLVLAELDVIYPAPKASVVETLETQAIDQANSFQIIALSASPDNQHLLVYSWQSEVGGWGYPSFAYEFTDMRIRFYDMNTGEIEGGFNEHIFTGHNKSVVSSVLFDEEIEAQLEVALPGDEPFILAQDYQLGVEGVQTVEPVWQWNQDGSVTVSYMFEVFITFPNSTEIQRSLGFEWFGVTYAFGANGMSREGFSDERVAALFPARFQLEPSLGPQAAMTVSGEEILFPYRPFWRGKQRLWRSREAVLIEGNIPRRYRYLRSMYPYAWYLFE